MARLLLGLPLGFVLLTFAGGAPAQGPTQNPYGGYYPQPSGSGGAGQAPGYGGYTPQSNMPYSPGRPGYPIFGPPPPLPAPTDRAVVEIFDNYFLPSFVFVTPGGTVRWINRGRHKHTVTALAGKPDSGDIPPGGAYTLKVTKPLNHEYYCRHHRLTMSGTIVVRALQAVTPPITPSGYYRPYAYLPGSFSRPPVSPVGGYQSPPPPGNPHGP